MGKVQILKQMLRNKICVCSLLGYGILLFEAIQASIFVGPDSKVQASENLIIIDLLCLAL